MKTSISAPFKRLRVSSLHLVSSVDLSLELDQQLDKAVAVFLDTGGVMERSPPALLGWCRGTARTAHGGRHSQMHAEPEGLG